MDDEKMPGELKKKIIILSLVLLIQSFLFVHFISSGLIIILGILSFMFVFSIKNKKLEKQSEKNLLRKEDWFKSKYTLSKEIP